MINTTSLEPLLRPASVAIVGASPRPDSFGFGLCTAIPSLGFAGDIYPINPGYTEVLGLKAYPSLAEVGGPVDCAAFAISDQRLEQGFEDAIRAGIRSAVLFGRAHGASRDGGSLTSRIADMAREANIPVCGGNCMGYVNLLDSLQMTGGGFRKLSPAGGIALVSHSGSSWSGLIGNLRGLGFNFAISAGQELSVTMAQYMSYLCDQPSTRVICCVMETIRDPEYFLATLDKAVERGIPVIALKLGRSEAGRVFAQSHSGAMSGRAEVYDAIFERAGVISVRTLDELLDTAELFSIARLPTAAGVALGGDSGGERQLITDLATAMGLPLARLAPATVSVLSELLDEGNEPANPLDFWGDKGVSVIAPAIQALAHDENVGTVVLATNMAEGRQFLHDCSDAIEATYAATSKPVVLMGNIATTVAPDEARRLRQLGIPVLMGTETGLRALTHFSRYHFPPIGRRSMAVQPAHRDVSSQWQERLTHPAPGHSPARESFEMLEHFSIPLAPWCIAETPQQAVMFADRVGYPVVAKIDHPDIAHKSDVGGVRLSLMDKEQLTAAISDLQAVHAGAVLVQKQLKGVELILGMSVDSQFGPVFTVGLGGIFVEILRDFAILLPGDESAMIQSKIASLKAFPLLCGARGMAKADIGLLVGMVQRFMEMGCRVAGAVAELELNPVLIDGDSIAAVDALIILKTRS